MKDQHICTFSGCRHGDIAKLNHHWGKPGTFTNVCAKHIPDWAKGLKNGQQALPPPGCTKSFYTIEVL